MQQTEEMIKDLGLWNNCKTGQVSLMSFSQTQPTSHLLAFPARTASFLRSFSSGLRGFLLTLSIFACFRSNNTQASKLPVLTVFAYSSFVSEWGPGLELQRRFESTCKCTVVWKKAEDGAALLTQIRLNPKGVKADLALGLDQNLLGAAQKTGAFSSLKLPKALHPRIQDLDHRGFVPFDFGPMAFVADTSKIKILPKSFEDLLTNKDFRKKVLLQDPRTSTPGLGLLVWLGHLANGKPQELKLKLGQLRSQSLTVTKGWTESYGLFTKGEAPLVWSYATSELYHRIEEKSSRYKALRFAEGHPLQVEYVGLLNSKSTLAAEFAEFLLKPDNQLLIATKNWMLPVLPFASIPQLPPEFSEIESFLGVETQSAGGKKLRDAKSLVPSSAAAPPSVAAPSTAPAPATTPSTETAPLPNILQIWREGFRTSN